MMVLEIEAGGDMGYLSLWRQGAIDVAGLVVFLLECCGRVIHHSLPK